MSERAAKKNDDDPWPPPARVNPDFVGHAECEQGLYDAFHSNRLAHAWLISGPKGVGKATLAYRFARYVLSQGVEADAPASMGLFGDEAPDPEPGSLWTDPNSSVFRRIASGGHADLMCIERGLNKQGKPRTEIVIEDVRGIGGFLSLTAAEGGWRVVVIDCADDMNRNAANAVLKVLEEPPARALLLLISHNSGRLLPTIRSRCRKLVVPGLSEPDMIDLLERYVPGLGREDRDELARLSEGSIGRAVDLAGAGGLNLYHDVLSLLGTYPKLDIPLLHKLAGNWSKAGADDTFTTMSDILLGILSRFIRAQGSGQGGAMLPPSERALYGTLNSATGLDRWLEVWEKITDLLGRTDVINLDRKQVVLNVFLEIDGAVRSA